MTAIIQSIQPFTITISTATTVGTAAISAVNTSMSVIIPNGARNLLGNQTGWERMMSQLVLSSSVLVSAIREVAHVTTTIVTGTVVEFANFVNSIQSGTIVISTGTTGNTAAINAVSTRAFIIWQGMSKAAPTSVRSAAAAAVKLNSSVEVQAVVLPSSLGISVRYAVVDLTSDIVDTVEHIDLSAATTSTVDTATISAVDPGLTFIAHGGYVSTGTGGGGNTVIAGYVTALAGATSVQFIRSSSVSLVVRRHLASVVQLKSQALATTVQRNSITNSTTTGLTGTATIAAVSTRAFLNCPYAQGHQSTSAGMSQGTATLTMASTLVTATRFSTADALMNRFEVIEWASSIALGGASTSVGSGLVYGNLLSGHVRSPVNRAHYIMQGSV
jgi:hypothetical protein